MLWSFYGHLRTVHSALSTLLCISTGVWSSGLLCPDIYNCNIYSYRDIRAYTYVYISYVVSQAICQKSPILCFIKGTRHCLSSTAGYLYNCMHDIMANVQSSWTQLLPFWVKLTFQISPSTIQALHGDALFEGLAPWCLMQAHKHGYLRPGNQSNYTLNSGMNQLV